MIGNLHYHKYLTVFLQIISIPCATFDIPIHIISGARFIELPAVIPYHSSTQLLYKFPFHAKTLIKLPTTTVQKPSCPNSITKPNTYCTQKLHLEQIQNKLNIILNANAINLDPVYKLNHQNSSSRKKRAIDTIGNILSWCCNTATLTNLHDLSKNEKQVDDKLNDLLDYVKEEHADITIAEIKMSNFSSNIDHILHQLHSNLQTYENKLQSEMNLTTTTIEEKILINNLEIMSYIYLSTHYSKLYKVEQDCQKNYIPEDLLDMATLASDLQKLSKKLISYNLTMAISPSKLYHIYSLPISKCYFENEDIILQIKIPLIPINTSYTAYKYLPIPLKWENNICNLVENDFIVIKASTSSIFLIETHNNPLCNPQTSNLCLIPRYTSSSSPASKCAKYLINGTNIAELKNYCEFHCTSAPQHPIVTELEVNKFLITNYKNDIHITCDGNILTKKLPRIDFGAVEIELPCHCKLHDNSEIIINTITPCDSRDFTGPSITHLVPLPWTNLDHLKIDPFDTDRTEFQNISSYVLPTWNISVPTFSNPKLERVTLFNHINLATSWTDVIDDKRIIMYILLAWCSIITIITIILMYKIHLLNVKQKLLTPPRDYHLNSYPE